MKARQCVRLKPHDLSYSGLVDFGQDDEVAANVDEKADYALVFMYQPLENVHAAQPISIFAARGPVQGMKLAELVIEAIVLVERCGAKIHGVVGDGAPTNRAFWTHVGASGKQDRLINFFAHPTDENRKVFLFSDTPHLIKCVRNRLQSHDLRVTKWYIIDHCLNFMHSN